MKNLFLATGIILFVVACSSQKGIVKVNKSTPAEIVEDSLEYELETFDAKFETWYQMHKSPALNRSQSYYENWNKRYVSEWNYKASRPGRNSFFEPIIGYDYSTDFGFDLNHELFYYFQYVEHVLKIQILPGGGPKAVIF